MFQPFRFYIVGALLMAACAPTGRQPVIDPLDGSPQIASFGAEGPENAAPGTCWGLEEIPATLETITEEVVLTPAEPGAGDEILVPAVTATRSRQEIAEPRRELWFETPCPASLTPDNVATLQRALAARGLFGGQITGSLDAETRDAIRRFQQPLGLDSSVLSLAAARRLGLVTIDAPEADETAG
ncbi:peptidoglycan-binding domain-containing protein [Tropicimonas sediminicola]|uniref:Putative peptidoglycan binding domain-containing protein n=1 Tax=Tropicimonas sediminicola TaxID=1031541 RepID=A0A239CXH9_9RHOB|nr:peptidoglycan-binding domain-containing protein [Tropicimonas sediminicola]SNS24351.1 Putative peptidoglycan binding domain-containing protein [Tropicimonas sediminicola]